MGTPADTHLPVAPADDRRDRRVRRRLVLWLVVLVAASAATAALALPEDAWVSLPGRTPPGQTPAVGQFVTAPPLTAQASVRPSAQASGPPPDPSTPAGSPEAARSSAAPWESAPGASASPGSSSMASVSPPAAPTSAASASPTPVSTPLPTTAPAPTDGPPGPTDGDHFMITGDIAGLVPDRWSPIRITVTNPTGLELRITSITVTLGADSVPPGCPSAVNLRLTQSSVSTGAPLTVPSGASVTLSDAPLAPQIVLLDLPDVNQDVCQGASFSLSYSGTAE